MMCPKKSSGARRTWELLPAHLFFCPSRIVHLVLCCVLPLAMTPKGENFTVGYLTNINGRDNPHRQGLVISGAIAYAIHRINSNSSILNGRMLNLIYNDTKGDVLRGTRAVIDQWQRGAIAFFGPEDSCGVEATVAASLKLPMLSFKCSDTAHPDFSRGAFHSYFARTYPPDSKIVSSVIALLRYYSWHKFSIICHNTPVFNKVSWSLEKHAQSNNFTINSVRFFENLACCARNNSCCQNPFPKIVEETYKGTRVYVFIGSPEDLIMMMFHLRMKGLVVSGEYVVIYVDLASEYSEYLSYKYFWRSNMNEDDVAASLEAIRSLLVVVPSPPRGEEYSAFEDKVREYNSKPPFMFRNPLPNYKKHITIYASYLYDAVMLYSDALSEVLRKGEDHKNGSLIIDLIKERKRYQSVTGAWMKIDKNGEVDGNYTVLSRLPIPENTTFKGLRTSLSHTMLPVGSFQYDDLKEELVFTLDRPIDWIKNRPPLDEPPCGFDGSICKEDKTQKKHREISLGVLSALCVVVAFISSMIYRNWKYEQEIAGLLWRINIEDLIPGRPGAHPQFSSRMSLVSQCSVESKLLPQIFTQTAYFKGAMVAIKQLHFSKKIIDIPRETKKEMKMIKEINHDNLTQFIGACVQPSCIYIVTEYCHRGSLQDILENDDIKLDNMFIASLVFDLIKGMIFLHDCDIKVHGNLKSSNCVISSRWVLRITDFGLHELRASAENESVAEHQYYRNLLWKAPELLRNPNEHPEGTQKGDVYSFGIILHEIIGRQGPFGYTDLNPKEIICQVKQQQSDVTDPFRPDVLDLECQDYVLQTMKDAWNERADLRPDFRHIRERLGTMRHGMKSNIMDNMMVMMEKYANNLEELVDERTAQLLEEKKKTEALLDRMLPKSVAAQLMRGEGVVPESFDAVTIYFSDIVGFTAMSATSTPLEVVSFLNDLYTEFDDIISRYDVYKVETIGDAYMVVSGLPIRNGDQHAGEIASMALELLEFINTFRIRHRPDQTLKLRIGIHTGPVVAGVVGLTMPRYCLFGDTVNTASRMESNGEALKIHISPQCKDYLEKLGGYVVQERGLVAMKGKGEVKTYWLLGHTTGPQSRRDFRDQIPLQPLFNTVREADIRRRSPKLSIADMHHRGSLINRRNSSFGHNIEDAAMNSGIPAFLRVNQDSPRPMTRYSPQRENTSLTYKSQEAKDQEKLQSVDENKDNTAPSSGYNSRLESAGSNECNICHITDERSCHCRIDNDVSKNGLIGMDDSLRPLLCSKECKVDILKRSENDRKHQRPSLLKLPSKRWRSCDEISLPKGSRSSLKDFFAGLLGNKVVEDGEKELNNAPVGICVPIQENGQEESLV